MGRARILAGAFLSLMSAAVVPMGCSGNQVGSVTATHKGGGNQSSYPDETVERFRECVAEYGSQLGPGNHVFDANVEMGEDGLTYGVKIENLPASAEDFGGCMRAALQSMPVSEKRFDDAMAIRKNQREQEKAALAEQKQLLGTPVLVVVGVTIVVSEVVLESGAITVLFATAVTLIDKVSSDAAEAELARRRRKDRCADYYEDCIASSLWRQYGRHEWDSLCSLCATVCFSNNGNWPSMVGVKDCNYKRSPSN